MSAYRWRGRPAAWEADVLPFERHPKYPWYPETLQSDDVISHGRVVEDRRDPIILVAATQESLVVNVLVKRGNHLISAAS